KLSGQVVNAPLVSAGVFLSGLQPDTTYHYRFVAQSSGGGPVRGVGGTPGLDGQEETFRTPRARAPLPPDTCPNARFRSGASAYLPDCRAYEMVSPLDKSNADVLVVGGERTPATYYQSAEAGDKLAYSAYRAFGDAQSAPWTSQYIAGRTGAGWTSHSVSPPRGTNILEILATADVEFKYFSPDLCSGWLVHDSDTLLAPGAPAKYAGLYRWDGCGPEPDAFSALSKAVPPHLKPKLFVPEIQGIADNGAHMIFRVADNLTADAPNLGASKPLLYESFGAGKLRSVCVLPNGSAANTGCSAGTASFGFNNTREHAVHNAISADGSRIFWSDAVEGPGKIYLRVEGKNPTLAVSGPDPAQFWMAADDGSKALFSYTAGTHDGELYEFDLAKAERKPIAGEVIGLLGASEDASRIYLVSEEALDGAAVAGAPNLYSHEVGGGFSFIATLSKDDAKQGKSVDSSPVNFDPSRHSAHVSADGLHVVFMSNGSPTGYDNRDVESGEPDSEVYRYDAESKALNCLSCNPTGVRPAGRHLTAGVIGSWVAARIRTAEKQLYSQRLLSEDGSRVFFESYERLVPADTNGKQDVYQWEEPGKGTCSKGAAAYSSTAGGCVSLISSGESSSDSRFLDANKSGTDVFIATASSLVPQDPGLFDIYDARVEGGFPTTSPKSACEGEACQNPPAAPVDATPASANFHGPGNPRRCPKGKRQVRKAGKVRCLQKKGQKQKRQRQRRAAS
ncbi:MAG TPA: hypothetical protein VEW07_11710, partial [Solirubrobacterales bacterium]|nr:hypothetical protein [Solirubrobacterales bacterium]